MGDKNVARRHGTLSESGLLGRIFFPEKFGARQGVRGLRVAWASGIEKYAVGHDNREFVPSKGLEREVVEAVPPKKGRKAGCTGAGEMQPDLLSRAARFRQRSGE
jgi:hypothetical protein